MVEGEKYIWWDPADRDEALASGDRIRMGDLSHVSQRDTADIVITRFFGSSGQQEDAVNLSNRRAFMRDFADSQGKLWWEVYGGFGYFDIAFLPDADEQDEAIADVLAGLESYPVLDEEEHSNTEQEQADGSWDYFGRSDFKEYLSGTSRFDRQKSRRYPMLGYSQLVVGTAREFLRQRVPTLEKLIYNVSDEVIMGIFDVARVHYQQPQWAEEVEELTDGDLDHVWNGLLREDENGEAVEMAGGGDVRFHFEKALAGWDLIWFIELLTDGPIGGANRLHGAVMFIAGMNGALLGDGMLNIGEGGFRVLFDLVYEEGGEWTPAAAKLLRQLGGRGQTSGLGGVRRKKVKRSRYLIS